MEGLCARYSWNLAAASFPAHAQQIEQHFSVSHINGATFFKATSEISFLSRAFSAAANTMEIVKALRKRASERYSGVDTCQGGV